jgi:hypothetical protein
MVSEEITKNKPLMKFFIIVAWICGIAAALIILTGGISLVSGKIFFGLRHAVNYFHVANSTLLLAILCLLANHTCLNNKNNPG